MHGELFKSRCDRCARAPFEDVGGYEGSVALPRCACGGAVRPHICWFGETPFGLERIYQALSISTVFVAIGTSGVVEPAASFAMLARRRARTVYVGPEEPANREAFSECYQGKSAEVLPGLFEVAAAPVDR
jgi:NAD-dependent deacetylase